ncbi:MAG: glycosyltransferase family 2 protein [Rhodococcus sp.]|nr:glycosyltransferase family 2 protein [Rhodococcus sp. (in: high G+C Gram-positive bacteria)]
MNHPRVGIVIPCHNDDPDHLREAVQSALHQSMPANVVVVNDGTTRAETLAAFSELPESVNVIHQPNAGLSNARNVGIASLDTDYIQVLDADDWLTPGFVEAAAAALTAGARIAAADTQLFGEANYLHRIPDRTILADMVDTNLIGSASMFHRSDWESVGGFDEDLFGASEDYEFWVRLLALGGEARRIPGELFHHRVRPNSLSALIMADFRTSRRITRAAMARNTPAIAGPALDRVDDLLDEVRRLREENAWWWSRFGFIRRAARRTRSLLRKT